LANPDTAVTFTLRRSTDGDTDHVEIYRVLPSQPVNHEPVPTGSTEIQLQNKHIVPGSVTFDFGSEKTYLNGKTELTAEGDYSLDYEQGILYLHTALYETVAGTISYDYSPWELVPADNWRFYGNSQSIQLDSQVFYSYAVSNEDLAEQSGTYLVQLANSCVVPGTITWSTGSGYLQELPYIDGVAEFLGTAYQLDESVPAGVTSFTLQHIPLASYQLLFTDQTALAIPVDDISKVVASGLYYVDYLTGKVTCFTKTVSSMASYYYHMELAVFDDCYSVDYRRGQIHLYKALSADAQISYSYTHYEVVYDIAELIPSTAYTLDKQTSTLTFTDARVITDILSRSTSNRILFAAYRYVNSSLLTSETYAMFTPVLADYALNALPLSLF
jgi:hypothetical protein